MSVSVLAPRCKRCNASRSTGVATRQSLRYNSSAAATRRAHSADVIAAQRTHDATQRTVGCVLARGALNKSDEAQRKHAGAMERKKPVFFCEWICDDNKAFYRRMQS